MEVAIIAGNYYKSNNGIGRYTNNLIKEIREIDVDIILKIIGESKNLSKVRTVSRLKNNFMANEIKVAIEPFINEYNQLSKFINNKNILIRELKDVNSQIYHAVSPRESIAAVLLKKRPLITTFHDIIPLISENRYLFEKYYFNYYCSLAKQSDIIIADSNKTKDDLIKFLNIDKGKIKVIYPGIDTHKFYPKISDNKSEIKNILYLGGLIKRKGVYETLYAFNKLIKVRRDVKLIFGGGGEEYSGLKKEASRLQLNEHITFLGFINENKIIDYYRSANLFIYPSKYEGFGYTPLEAMACGIPVITSSFSSIPEVVGDAAVKVNPYNIDEIFQEMNAVLNNEKLQKNMKEKGPIIARKFSLEKFAQEMLNVYNSF